MSEDIEQQKAVMQLKMAIACPVVKLEEWLGFAQIMPWHAEVIASRLGMDIHGLNQAVRAGGITGRQLENAIVPFAFQEPYRYSDKLAETDAKGDNAMTKHKYCALWKTDENGVVVQIGANCMRIDDDARAV